MKGTDEEEGGIIAQPSDDVNQEKRLHFAKGVASSAGGSN
jgi:hypothetical protein